MKKRINQMRMIASIFLCFGILCSNAFAAVGSFPDVPETADYLEAVEMLAELGIVKGDDRGNFNPDSTITRAEAATMICRLMGVEEEALAVKTSSFNDVPSEHWAVGYVTKCVELGIINGYGNGNFGPGDPVTYEQMVKLLVCAWGYGEMAEESGGYPTGYLQVAEDYGFAVNTSSMNSAPANRALVAVLFFNALSVPQYSET